MVNKWNVHSFKYELLNTNGLQFAEPSPGAELTPIRRLICGGIAGITSVTFTYPLDIVRTRLSIQSASFAELGHRAAAGYKLPGMFDTMVSMYKNEGGFLALYRGIIPTVAGVAPYVSVLFSTSRCFILINPLLSRLASTLWLMNRLENISRQREKKTLVRIGNY